MARLFDGGPVAAGVPVNEWNALTYSAVWSAVGQISSTVASLPLKFYKRTADGGKEAFTGHKLYELLHDNPNPEMTSFIFREILQAHLLTWGNGYAEIERDGAGRPAAIWPIPPDRVDVIRDSRDRVVYRVRGDRLGDIIIPAADMLHVPGLGFDGLKGYGVVQMARESLGLGLAAERFGGTFFGNGSTFGGFLSHPNKLGPEARQNLEASLAKHSGPTRAHRILLLQENMTFIERKGIPPNDAQFLETRLFQVQEVARWLRISPYKLGDLSRATFSNIEHQAIEYYTDTIRPWLVRWEQEINRKLVSPLERRQQFAEFVIEGALRGDVQSRYNAYAVGRQWGWLSADDVRGLENMNPLPNGQGNIYLLPQNMVPADRIGEIIDKQVRPEPKPVAPAPAAAPTDDQTNSLKRAIEHFEARIPELKSEADEARAEVVRCREALAVAGGAEVELRANLTAAEARLAQTGHDHAVVLATLALANEQKERLEARAAAAEAAAEALQAEQAGVVAAHAAAVAGRDEAERARAAADAARQQAEARVTEAAEAAARAAGERDEVRASVAAADAKVVELSGRVEALAIEVSVRTAQLDVQAAAAGERDASLSAELSQVREELFAKAADLETAETERDALRTGQAAADAALAAAQVDLAAARAANEERARELEAVSAQQAEAAAAVTELEARLARAESALAESQAEAESRATALAGAVAREAEQAGAAGEARQAQAAAEAELAGVAAARDAALEAVRQAEAERKAGRGALVSAHRALYQDAITRLLEREIDRILGARGTVNKLRTVMGPFYERHVELVARDLLPLVRVHLAFLRRDEDAEALAADLAQQHVALSKADLAEVYEANEDDFPTQLSQMIQRWRSRRTSDLAEYLMRREIEHG